MKTETENLRELDAWIGVNIFGMKAISKDGPPPTDGVEENYFVMEWIDISASLPHYTTDLAAAMQVLEKCAEALPGGVKVRRRKHDLAWTVAKFEDLSPVWSVSKTLPLAICRFAKLLFSK